MPTPPQQLEIDFARDVRGPKCKRCGAPVRKHYDQTGEEVALDVVPSDSGVYRLDWHLGEEWATKAPAEPPGTTRVVHRYSAHDATCPALLAERPVDWNGEVQRDTLHGREVKARNEPLTRSQRLELRADHAGGMTVPEIARKRQLPRELVRRAVRSRESEANVQRRAAIASRNAAAIDDYSNGFTTAEIATKLSWDEKHVRRLINKHPDSPTICRRHALARAAKMREEAIAAKRAARGEPKRGTAPVRSSQRRG